MRFTRLKVSFPHKKMMFKPFGVEKRLFFFCLNVKKQRLFTSLLLESEVNWTQTKCRLALRFLTSHTVWVSGLRFLNLTRKPRPAEWRVASPHHKKRNRSFNLISFNCR